MANSQNGWEVLDEPPPIADLIPGILRLRVCPGDVATIFTDLAQWYHKSIEPVNLVVEEKPGFDDWGWAKRLVRDSLTTISNHASGTAIDLNATRYPRGTRHMSQLNKNKIHTWLENEYENIVRWGGDYRTVVDEMHFEINTNSKASVRRIANKIKARWAEEEEAMAIDLDDIIDLGPSQSVILSETGDNEITVEQAIAHLTASSVLASQLLRQMISTQEKTNALLASLVNRAPVPETGSH